VTVRRRGFTLTELLTLVALTGVLVGLLLPVLSQGRDRAEAAACVSNLRQLVLLHQSDLQRQRWGNSAYDLGEDADGGAGSGPGPEFDYGGEGEDKHPTYVEPDIRYRGEIVFHQRMEWEAAEAPRSWNLHCRVAERASVNSFGMNFLMRYRKFEQATSRDVVFGDSPFKVVDVPGNYEARHGGRVSLAFGDGHVEFVVPTEIFTSDELSLPSDRLAPNRGGH